MHGAGACLLGELSVDGLAIDSVTYGIASWPHLPGAPEIDETARERGDKQPQKAPHMALCGAVDKQKKGTPMSSLDALHLTRHLPLKYNEKSCSSEITECL